MRASSTIICAFLVANVSVALAAEPAGKKEFERGKLLFESGDYERACPQLRAAYQLTGGRPSTIRALAQCERAFQNNQKAIELFEELLATNPKDVDAIKLTIQVLEQEQTEELRGRSPNSEEEDLFLQNQRPVSSTTSSSTTSYSGTPLVSPSEETSLTDSPIFWGVLSALVAVGATVLVVGLVSGDEPRQGGSLGLVVDF